MATLLRVLLLGIVILMPGGLLVLPFLAMHQVKSAKKQNLSGREQTPLAIT
jgi:hypothetical protein